MPNGSSPQDRSGQDQTQTQDQVQHDREQKIRERAFHIWNEEGQPSDKADDHWERARREIDGSPADDVAATPPKGTAFGP